MNAEITVEGKVENQAKAGEPEKTVLVTTDKTYQIKITDANLRLKVGSNYKLKGKLDADKSTIHVSSAELSTNP